MEDAIRFSPEFACLAPASPPPPPPLAAPAAGEAGEGGGAGSAARGQQQQQQQPSPAPPLKGHASLSCLSDHELRELLLVSRRLRMHQLECALGDAGRAVRVRRAAVEALSGKEGALGDLPFHHYEYEKVSGVCCENVVGYATVPVGVVGPLPVDGKPFFVPLATTEGCLVASTNRGCAALRQSGGVSARVVEVGMTRGAAVRLPSAARAEFARLAGVDCRPAGCTLYLRFRASTGDAMGMNMVTKGVEVALHALEQEFEDLEVVSLSANFCADKKATALNWINGRGREVVCEAVVPASVLEGTLRTTAGRLASLNVSKNLVGSALAGAVGGCNAHAANIVAAIFLATGQDLAQVVCSSFCLTQMDAQEDRSLRVSCTMPCLEVGTVGGGTSLPSQRACLQLLGASGPSEGCPGENAALLASVICATVLAGELSLMAALAEGELVRSHMRLNRTAAADPARPDAAAVSDGYCMLS